MNFVSLIFGVGSVGPFASRVFLPAFVTAVMLRFGVHVPVIEHLLLLQHVHHQPAWFTSDAALIVLGVLATLEVFGQKNVEVRNLFHDFDVYLKPALAVLTSLGVMATTDAGFVQNLATHQASLIDGFIPLLVAVATFHVAGLRQRVAQLTYEHLDGTHVDHLLSWAEDAWAGGGALLVVLFPVVACALVLVGVGALVSFRRRLDVREEQTKVACTNCGRLNFASAIRCAQCAASMNSPRAVGFWGQSRVEVPAELETHAYRLFEKRRCPVCANRLPARQPLMACRSCGDTSHRSPAFTDAFLGFVAARLPIVLGVSFSLGLIPVVGLIFGLIYSRSMLVLPFSQYLPLRRQWLLRWGIRLLFLVLVFVQMVPLLGAFVVPVMALISFVAYRDAYARLLKPDHLVGASVSIAIG